VIQRQRVQRQVALGDTGIDNAADILPDHRVMGQHRAFWGRLRAAGVDDLRQIGPAEFDIRRRSLAGRKRIEADHVGLRRAGLFGGKPDQIAHGGVEHDRGARQRGEAAIGGQHGRAGVPQYVGDFLGLQHEIDRHQHRAKPRQRKPHRDKAVGVTRQHRHPRALGDAALRETRGDALADAIEFRISPTGIAAHHREFARHLGGAAMQQIGKGLTTRDRMHAGGFRPKVFVGAVCLWRGVVTRWCASSFETHRFAMLLRMRSEPMERSHTLMVRSASSRVSNHEATGGSASEPSGERALSQQ
jgi:hypothetical protein